MNDDENDDTDAGGLRSSSHTLSLPASLQAHLHLHPRHFRLPQWSNFSLSLSGKASGEWAGPTQPGFWPGGLRVWADGEGLKLLTQAPEILSCWYWLAPEEEALGKTENKTHIPTVTNGFRPVHMRGKSTGPHPVGICPGRVFSVR